MTEISEMDKEMGMRTPEGIFEGMKEVLKTNIIVFFPPGLEGIPNLPVAIRKLDGWDNEMFTKGTPWAILEFVSKHVEKGGPVFMEATPLTLRTLGQLYDIRPDGLDLAVCFGLEEYGYVTSEWTNAAHSLRVTSLLSLIELLEPEVKEKLGAAEMAARGIAKATRDVTESDLAQLDFRAEQTKELGASPDPDESEDPLDEELDV